MKRSRPFLWGGCSKTKITLSGGFALQKTQRVIERDFGIPHMNMAMKREAPAGCRVKGRELSAV